MSRLELADYEEAIPDYDAAVDSSGLMRRSYVRGLPSPPAAADIRLIARAVRQFELERQAPTGEALDGLQLARFRRQREFGATVVAKAGAVKLES